MRGILIRFVGLLGVLFLTLPANAATIYVHDNTLSYGQYESPEVISTLTNLGHTVVTGTTYDFTGVDLFFQVTGIGSSTSASTDALNQGVAVIQLGDWDNTVKVGSYPSSLYTTNPYTIVNSGTSPITTGLDSSWVEYGFHHYGFAKNIQNDPNGGFLFTIANGDTAATATGYAGNSVATGNENGTNWVYLGFNVYGSEANANSIQLLENSIQWATTGTVSAVPIPAAFWLFGSAIGLLGWMRRKKA